MLAIQLLYCIASITLNAAVQQQILLMQTYKTIASIHFDYFNTAHYLDLEVI